MTAATADLTALAARLTNSGADIRKTASELIQKSAVKVQAEAMALAPVKTGKLKGSITVKLSDATTATIGPTVPYGRFQEFGTGTRGEFPGPMYDIVPVKSKYLTFRTKEGRFVKTKIVHHPGIKAHPYMRPAVKKVIESLAPDLAKSGALLITKGPRG